MLKEKYSYRKDIETCKNPKSKEKMELMEPIHYSIFSIYRQ